jgi:hypothetical protein
MLESDLARLRDALPYLTAAEQAEALALLEAQAGTLTLDDLPPDLAAALARAARDVKAGQARPGDRLTPDDLSVEVLAQLLTLMDEKGARAIQLPDDFPDVPEQAVDAAAATEPP